ncbi:hypothetical protein BZM27_23260 [Paraburkholderia steynii]|uniref:Transposase n=1 Tax=Paraburkholderia steynii TaxID=1245441 RepID=A0A4R0XIE6_9BURK|nr:hypothetical protein BZM27_23260 [Paraburkholderia steynii]
MPVGRRHVHRRARWHLKVRYRGLMKNPQQLHTLFARSNLWMTRERLCASPLHERKIRPSGQAIGAFLMSNVALHSSQVPHRLHRIGPMLMAQCGKTSSEHHP